MDALRFGVGDEVECQVGVAEWARGKVVALTLTLTLTRTLALTLTLTLAGGLVGDTKQAAGGVNKDGTALAQQESRAQVGQRGGHG